MKADQMACLMPRCECREKVAILEVAHVAQLESFSLDEIHFMYLILCICMHCY